MGSNQLNWMTDQARKNTTGVKIDESGKENTKCIKSKQLKQLCFVFVENLL